MGTEALIRWHNSRLGQVQPTEFIPIAEKNGLIFPISDWVFRQACRELRNMLKFNSSLRMSINLSAAEFSSPTHAIIERLCTIVEEECVKPSNIELEITETDIMQNYDIAIPMMMTLKKQGFHIACDDFGNGYSSLNHLKKLPIDTLKIDKTFVENLANDIHDKTIIQAILLIARSFNLRVIAEGVETLSQLKALKKLGCHIIQGNYFSAGVTASECRRMILK